MEVDYESARLLTNLEVLQLINSRLESKKKIRSQQTLLYTCSKYLKTRTPCAAQSADSVRSFTKAVKSFKFTKLELLMLINHCPSTQVELSVLLSDMDSRFSPDQIEQLLKIIGEHFPESVAASQSINAAGASEEGDDAR
ncbi:RNA polymerase III subunit C17 [Opisthorchis viverrini]|uniref:DNA-directed RNA polymerase III subunit RPC9 n=1 Tax=Opisthorchis viverrini TaxID=6198 RepID=A0A1S8WRJ4_OPIVI|nr:RNA polymerase III subunit C17 [Opisthorchis viverrini]OON17067.1 RNA polymerase III subunit C17 [Opisthorchis viverrini]